jgi:hypothetical protein
VAIHIESTSVHDPYEALASEADELRAHPRFAQARAAYLAGLIRWREASPLIHKLSANKARMHVAGYLLHLSACNSLGGGDGSVAYGDLHEMCAREDTGIGARVLKTMLALMTLARFVERRRDAADRRLRFYRPTRRMFDHARVAYGYAAGALDAIDPAMDRLGRLESDQQFFLSMLASAGRAHAEAPPDRLMPEFIGFIGNREGSGPVLAAIMQAEMLDLPVQSRAALAGRFGLSKSQATRIVGESVERGYLAVDEKGDTCDDATPAGGVHRMDFDRTRLPRPAHALTGGIGLV